MDNRAWLEMMEEATCYRDNGLGMVRASRMPPALGTGCANNRPIKTVYAANVKPRIARNLRLNVIYSTRGAPSPPPPSLWGEGVENGREWFANFSVECDSYTRVKLDHVHGKFVFSLNFNADGLIIFVKRGI